jgi:hypothetical protein
MGKSRGRPSKFDVPSNEIVTLSMRVPKAFTKQCPKGKQKTDWVRFDLLNISKDGKSFNSHNTVTKKTEEIDLFEHNLLMKLIKGFVENGVSIDLEENEIDYIKKSWEMIK